MVAIVTTRCKRSVTGSEGARDHHIREGRFARPHEHGAAKSGNGVTASWEDASADVSRSPTSPPRKRCGSISRAGRIASACLQPTPAESSIEHDEACKTGMHSPGRNGHFQGSSALTPALRSTFDRRRERTHETSSIAPAHSSFRTLAALASVALLAVRLNRSHRPDGGSPRATAKADAQPARNRQRHRRRRHYRHPLQHAADARAQDHGGLVPTARSRAPARTPPHPHHFGPSEVWRSAGSGGHAYHLLRCPARTPGS